jgi:DNA-binding NarL/FixJ family response regulator
MNSPVKVLIADDHARTRALVRAALERGEFVICAEAANCDAAIEEAKATRPDVCLLDINMPGSGIAAARGITSALPGAAVVMLTVSRQDEDLFDALRAGATGYLLKGMDEDSLSVALRQVLNGETPLPPSLVTRLVEEFRDREDRRIGVPGDIAARLTGREWDVLELMRTGASTEEIASRLFISATTVRSHVSAVLRKLGVADRDAAVKLLEGSPTLR